MVIILIFRFVLIYISICRSSAHHLCLDNFSQLSFINTFLKSICQSNLYHISSCLHHCISLHETSTVISFFNVIRQIFKWLVNKLKKKGRRRRCSPCASSKEAVYDNYSWAFSSSLHSLTINSSLVTSYFTHSNSIRTFTSKWRKTPVIESCSWYYKFHFRLF